MQLFVQFYECNIHVKMVSSMLPVYRWHTLSIVCYHIFKNEFYLNYFNRIECIWHDCRLANIK